jgi:hypothetical protein
VTRLARDGLLALRSARDGIRGAVRCDYHAAASLLWSAAEIAGGTAIANAASVPAKRAELEGAAREALGAASAAHQSIRGS